MKSKNGHFLFFTECCSDCAIKNHWILASTNALFMMFVSAESVTKIASTTPQVFHKLHMD